MNEDALISELVRAEIAALVTAGTIPASVAQDAAFIAYLNGAITEQAIAASPELYAQLVRSVTLPLSETVLAEAREMAARQAATLATRMAESELKAMGDAIANGLLRGDGVDAIARTLDMVKELDTNRAKQLDNYIADLRSMGLSEDEVQRRAEKMQEKLLRERRKDIAQTEARYALEEGHRIDALAAGKEWMAWITVGDDRVSDICASYEANGWIPIGQDFEGVGSAPHPPGHPRCRCTVAYRKSAPDELAKQRAQERIAQTAAAKEDGQTSIPAVAAVAEKPSGAKELAEMLKDDYGINKLDPNPAQYLEKIDPALIDETVGTVTSFLDDYPQVKIDVLSDRETVGLNRATDVLAEYRRDPFNNNNYVVLYDSFRDESIMKKSLENAGELKYGLGGVAKVGYIADPSVRGILNHELGHGLQKVIDQNDQSLINKTFRKFKKERMMSSWAGDWQLSAYALSDNKEFFAETFAAYRAGRRDSMAVKALAPIFEKHKKGV